MTAMDDLKYLKVLSQVYKNINESSGEIINLQAILNMPKGTEHFVSDLHGEYEAFSHTLKNASGVIRNYIDEMFGNTLMQEEKKHLATLIYYPKEKLDQIKMQYTNPDEWYRIYFFRLLVICKRVSSKYTRSKVRKAMPKEFAYILDELIQEDSNAMHKQAYYNQIIETIIKLDRAEPFIIAICLLIQRLAIDHLHVIGDIYDRGSGADKIVDFLMGYHSLDIEWGNHDISWMGAASGCEALICNVIRLSARYNNLHTIEEGYGINLIPLATFAMEAYADDECTRFYPEYSHSISEKESALTAKMHKAITIMQFKAEAEIILKHPEYKMSDRLFLDKINFDNMTVTICGVSYPLSDVHLPTVSKESPFSLTNEEREILSKIRASFLNSKKLQSHARFLFNKGSMYLIINNNLLFHGCVPLTEDGSYSEIEFGGKTYKGKALLDMFDVLSRKGWFSKNGSPEKQNGLDAMWYLWCGPNSPLFGKNKMTTFERYFTDSKELAAETQNPYYTLRDNEKIVSGILADFGLNASGARIINGHTPVMVKKGESPIKANGKAIVIDGGYSKAYQPKTGIAGYTLISNSQGVLLSAHEAFISRADAIKNSTDIVSDTQYIEKYPYRKKVSDTDMGNDIRQQIDDLEKLYRAYRDGTIKET